MSESTCWPFNGTTLSPNDVCDELGRVKALLGTVYACIEGFPDNPHWDNEGMLVLVHHLQHRLEAISDQIRT
jgi:hypothetical protein